MKFKKKIEIQQLDNGEKHEKSTPKFIEHTQTYALTKLKYNQ